MNHKQKGVLAAAVAASLGGIGAADAATYSATLTSVTSYSSNGAGVGNISSSTATWSYDDVTNLLSQTGGQYNVRFMIGGDTGATLFRHSASGMVVGNSGPATGTSFSCKEGNFGSTVGAHICGNYGFGSGGVNESSVTWGPGTTTARTLGGNDINYGPVQSLASSYSYFSTVSWVGTTLTLGNAACNPFAPGNANGCATNGGYNTGYVWVLNAGPQPSGVPVPAAVWLFGSALGLLGVARRKAANKA